MLKLAAIVGPTAIGKTEVSLQVAANLSGEIISCDSMQIYKGMDIGTAKAGIEERQLVPHHMLDIVPPDRNFSVAEYQHMVKKLIEDINNRSKLPIMVGGTGLYYQAVVDNYDFFPLESQRETRNKWNYIIAERGLDYAYHELYRVDPDYAAKIAPVDQKRIIRALEVYELTGTPFSALQKKKQKTYNLSSVGLYIERQELYQRIDKRVDEMISKGLVEEVICLRQKGYNLSHNSMQALGYKQVLYYLEGFLNWEEMLREIKRETRRYAKRQLTWFKKDKQIIWINASDYGTQKALAQNISAIIEGQLSNM